MTRPINATTALIGAAALLLAACQKPEPTDDGFGISSAAPASALPTEASSATPASALPEIALIPQAFRGHWDADEEGCQTGDKAPLRISEGSLDYWEDSSEARTLKIISPTHIKIAADDYGEETSDMKPGDTTLKGHSIWDLTLLDNGDTLKDVSKDGSIILRIRCKPPSADDPAAQ